MATLDARLIKDFDIYANKQFKNSLNGLLPTSLIPFIISLCGIDCEKQVNIISKKERLNLANLLKNLTFTIDSLDSLDRAIVTAGGIDTKEINPKNMQSKLIDNLFFAGEIIDVDALTGGFNLQIAFATAFLAGSNS
jgi:predicted Rossmann fold flavoprotein